MGGVFAERFNRTIRYLVKKAVFLKGDASWFDILLVITKQYTNRIHPCTNLTPIQASLKKNEGFVHKSLLDNRKKIKPNYRIGDLVRTLDKTKTFSKSHTTTLSYKLYENTEIIKNTIASYRIDNLPERYIEALLKKTNLTKNENDSVMKKLNGT